MLRLTDFLGPLLPRSCAWCGLLALVDGTCALKSSKGLGHLIGSVSQTYPISYANEHVFLGADVKLTRATRIA